MQVIRKVSISLNIKQSPADLSEFRVTQLVRPQPAEGPVQHEELQGVAVESPTDQETREVWCQEEQWADVSLIGHKDREEWCLDSSSLLHFMCTSVKSRGVLLTM